MLAQHRLGVELHPGEGRPAQRVHVAVCRRPGRPRTGPYAVSSQSPVGHARRTSSRSRPVAGRPKRSIVALHALVRRVPAVQRQPEQRREDLVAQADGQHRAARRRAGPSISARIVGHLRVAGRRGSPGPGTDHHQVEPSPVPPTCHGASAASRAGRAPRSWWASIAGEGVLAVDDQRPCGRRAPGHGWAVPGSRASSQNRASVALRARQGRAAPPGSSANLLGRSAVGPAGARTAQARPGPRRPSCGSRRPRRRPSSAVPASRRPAPAAVPSGSRSRRCGSGSARPASAGRSSSRPISASTPP